MTAAASGPTGPADPPLGDAPPLRLSFDGPLAVLTIDRPPENVFDHAMLDCWRHATDWLTRNPPRALLINAHGRVVSTGLDVTILDELSRHGAERFWAEQLDTVRALEGLPCPTVFAAHGLTLTAAFEIALACDFVLATGTARFGLVERRVAFVPSMGGLQRLAARAGRSRAAQLVMSGDLYRASTLADWGVVDSLFDPAIFAEQARAYAMRLAHGPTRAHAATKRVLAAVRDGGVAAADAVQPRISGAVARTEDHRRAVRAFLVQGPRHETVYFGR
ncbi:enoyl-CoA hydratase/isomerase family protein [Nonomuraea sp. NPDC050786]|uniref:enoyl-CoA hydratase/isomerase family protein n=1 Tax=Nonomuraea sp. NPDC050786 TaxID=3154840 RepID=UPI0033EBF47F